MKVLITGASGYIGRQLAEKLSAAGHDVSCMVRNAERSFQLHYPQIKFVEADALQAETLPAALNGIDVAYYLIHSMSGRVEGFELRDRQAAHNFAMAAKQCGVRRVIYLGGLWRHSLGASQEPPRNGRGVARIRAASRRTAGRHHRWQWQYVFRNHSLPDRTAAGHDLPSLGNDKNAADSGS